MIVNLIDEKFIADFSGEIEQFKKRKITGSKLVRIAGGALVSDMLNGEGNAFLQTYYFENVNAYITDLESTLVSGLPSQYHVPDTWDNYEKIQKQITNRYEFWKKAS